MRSWCSKIFPASSSRDAASKQRWPAPEKSALPSCQMSRSLLAVFIPLLLMGGLVGRLFREFAVTPTAADSVTANSRNRRPTSPPISSSGMKTATSDRLIDRTVKPTSPEPTNAVRPRQSLFQVPRNVFEHHDRIVDDEPRRDGQRHQRKVVEAVARNHITPNVPSSTTAPRRWESSPRACFAGRRRRRSRPGRWQPAASARRRGPTRGWSSSGPR